MRSFSANQKPSSIAGNVPTWRLLQELPAETKAPVPLERVLKQRSAILEVNVHALRCTQLETLLEEASEIAAHGANAAMAKILALQPDGNLRVVAGHGLEVGAEVRGDASNPAGECVVEERIIAIRDLRKNASRYELPAILPGLGVVSTINVPILVVSGAYGVLEVDATEPRDFDALDRSFLIGLAGIIGEGVERVRRERDLDRALRARDALLREHHHRVRNNYQVLLGILARHARDAGTDDARERFADIERRLFALASIYDHLVVVAYARSVSLRDYLLGLCDGLREFHGLEERRISLTIHGTDEVSAEIEPATAIGIVVNELIANSIEHAFDRDGGSIRVSITREDGGVCVSVSDSGVGYRQPAHETIGLTTMRRLAGQIDASLEVESNGGTTWKIRVPLQRLAQQHPFGGAKPTLNRAGSKKAGSTS